MILVRPVPDQQRCKLDENIPRWTWMKPDQPRPHGYTKSQNLPTVSFPPAAGPPAARDPDGALHCGEGGVGLQVDLQRHQLCGTPAGLRLRGGHPLLWQVGSKSSTASLQIRNHSTVLLRICGPAVEDVVPPDLQSTGQHSHVLLSSRQRCCRRSRLGRQPSLSPAAGPLAASASCASAL